MMLPMTSAVATGSPKLRVCPRRYPAGSPVVTAVGSVRGTVVVMGGWCAFLRANPNMVGDGSHPAESVGFVLHDRTGHGKGFTLAAR